MEQIIRKILKSNASLHSLLSTSWKQFDSHILDIYVWHNTISLYLKVKVYNSGMTPLKQDMYRHAAMYLQKISTVVNSSYQNYLYRNDFNCQLIEGHWTLTQEQGHGIYFKLICADSNIILQKISLVTRSSSYLTNLSKTIILKIAN